MENNQKPKINFEIVTTIWALLGSLVFTIPASIFLIAMSDVGVLVILQLLFWILGLTWFLVVLGLIITKATPKKIANIALIFEFLSFSLGILLILLVTQLTLVNLSSLLTLLVIYSVLLVGHPVISGILLILSVKRHKDSNKIRKQKKLDIPIYSWKKGLLVYSLILLVIYGTSTYVGYYTYYFFTGISNGMTGVEAFNYAKQNDFYDQDGKIQDFSDYTWFAD